MSDTDRLAALLHDDFTLSGFWSCVHSPENEWAPWCDVLARRLIAAGVTLAPQPDTASRELREAERLAAALHTARVECYALGVGTSWQPDWWERCEAVGDKHDADAVAIRAALAATEGEARDEC